MNLNGSNNNDIPATNLEEEELVKRNYYVLTLEVYAARDIDRQRGPFKNRSAWYQVCVTESMDQRQFSTKEVQTEGKVGPVWKEAVHIELEELPTGKEEIWLFIEVLRRRSSSSGGGGDGRNASSSSTGVNVVGRVKIPVPTQLGDYGTRAQQLVRMAGDEKKVESLLNMRLKLTMNTRFMVNKKKRKLILMD
ncbi:OLC1v1018407C2 [Oldenlandia corymbosa var. corymbosa]|nr:OLC1v1018407C2 [Oldenlandia corymbosa var. corymbosa]